MRKGDRHRSGRDAELAVGLHGNRIMDHDDVRVPMGVMAVPAEAAAVGEVVVLMAGVIGVDFDK